ncbi:MAG: outer membrane protein assembly factor BamB family protein [Pirellulales bacterium]
MNSRLIMLGLLSLSCSFTLSQITAAEPSLVNDGFTTSTNDWPWWRGAGRMGAAAADQQPPLVWSDSKNVAWEADIPGRGHGSMTVVGESIYLATADDKTGSQSVLCFDRTTGKPKWTTEVHATGGMQKNSKASAASSTLACDGERLFVTFPNSNGLYVTALDLAGKQLWQNKVSKYLVHQGYGASPCLYQSLVIVSSDNKGGGAVAAYQRKSGKLVWKHDRPKKPNYSSPTILHVAGKDQLIMIGCDLVTSLHPLTGKVIWETEGATTECVISTVTDGQLVYTGGGYPKNHISAVKADGSGELAWENKSRVYVPSLQILDGYLYGLLDAGMAACWKADTGEEMWKARLGGTFTASPVLVGDMLFATNEAGETFIYNANPKEYAEIAKNQLGSEVYSTMVICGDRIYYRAANEVDGKRVETLYCIAK